MASAVRATGPTRPAALGVRTQLELAAVTKTFTRRGGVQSVLVDVDLTVLAGEFVALTGASGVGKTTLLELAVGLQRPSKGTVQLGGAIITDMSDARMAALRLAKVGLLFKQHALIDTLGAVDNVALPLQLAGTNARRSLERASSLLERLGLGHLRHELPGELSQGERQRLLVARALVNGPELLVADEPTAGLDSVASDEVMRLLARQVDESGLTILMATHDARAAAYAGSAYRLAAGGLERA
jgi:putative ABC transport system ATP-binding protein